MAFSLTFDTGNAAFCEDGLRDESARILRRVAERLADGETEGLCMDANGNRVGSWRLD